MQKLKFKGLLNNSGWISPAYVALDDLGKIIDLSEAVEAEGDYVFQDAYVIPGFINAHSHAFQYGMGGVAEIHAIGKKADDFWSWRDAMYKLALSIDPSDIKGIAKMLYLEMVKQGYTHVAEFHYVHHDKNGNPFNNKAEMGIQLIEAAKEVGIGITLIPIFYQKGGFGKVPTEGQKRFISPSIDAYNDLFLASKQACSVYENASIAIGIHSMRGVEPDNIKRVAEDFDQEIPFHIHVSEQLKEVEDAINYLGKRPVEWLADNLSLTNRFNLVHATHVNDYELNAMASTGANVVLCPSTEGNLGDGIFPLIAFQKLGGNWSIGTDSHIGISPLEELRILDYGQRLISHKRNIFNGNEMGDSGHYAIDKALKAGRLAIGDSSAEYFKVGDFFNAVLFDANAPLIHPTSVQNLASTIVYASDTRMIKGTFVRGKQIVSDGQHNFDERIQEEFKNVIKKLQFR